MRDSGRKLANDFALNWVGLPTVGDLDLPIDPPGGIGILRSASPAEPATP